MKKGVSVSLGVYQGHPISQRVFVGEKHAEKVHKRKERVLAKKVFGWGILSRSQNIQTKNRVLGKRERGGQSSEKKRGGKVMGVRTGGGRPAGGNLSKRSKEETFWGFGKGIETLHRKKDLGKGFVNTERRNLKERKFKAEGRNKEFMVGGGKLGNV